MDAIEILREQCKSTSKKEVAERYSISISHLNNLLSGRKKVSKFLEHILKKSPASNEASFIISSREDKKLYNILLLLEKLPEEVYSKSLNKIYRYLKKEVETYA